MCGSNPKKPKWIYLHKEMDGYNGELDILWAPNLNSILPQELDDIFNDELNVDADDIMNEVNNFIDEIFPNDNL